MPIASALGPARSDWVNAAPFRAHVVHLMNNAQVPWPVVAYQAGVPRAAVRTLLFGRNGHIRPKIAYRVGESLLALRPDDLAWLRTGQIDATRTGRHLRALRAYRLTWTQISHLVQLDQATCQAIAAGHQPWCAALTDVLAQCACEQAGLTPDSDIRANAGWRSAGDPA